MRKLPSLFVGFLLCLPLFVYSDNGAEYYDYSFARMSYVTGDVFIERASDMGYEQGTVNLPVVTNDKLGTREGRAEIHFGKKNYLRIDRYTHVDFAGLPTKGYDLVKLNVLSGSIYLRVNFLEREKDFEVHTPDASFYILEEGLYGIKVVENSETEIHVVEGAVEAAGEEGSVLVESEERLVASNGAFRTGPEYMYASYTDSFSEWNNSRDDLLFRPVQNTYLPSELYEYESELAANGRWVYESSYGYVWVPHVYHHTWRPYYHGRWLWYPACGWTWIPSVSWGWCVSHYGRWHWRFGLGWYWIPTCSWGPAWVHWHWGYDYISWCPVSYWGYPVVVQNNYFYGRWNHRYYPVNSRALTVIHKNQLQAPRISKVALSQSHANRLGKISLSAKQPGVKAVTHRNSLTSQKASKVLARSNIRKVGKSYSSTRASSSALRSQTQRNTGKSRSQESSFKRSGQTGLIKNSVPRSSSRTSAATLSSRPVKRSSRSSTSVSSGTTRARTAIKNYPSQATSPKRTPSVGAGRTIRSKVAYPGRTGTKESVKREFRARSQDSGSLSQKTGIQRSSDGRPASPSIKVYSSRKSYTSRSYSQSVRSRSSSTLQRNTKSPSSYDNESRYKRPSRFGNSSERSRTAPTYRSSRTVKSSPSYRSSSSYRTSSSSRSSPRSTSRGQVSSRSSSSFRTSQSSAKSRRSSSSYRSSSGKVSSSQRSAPSRGRTSSGSKSAKRVSKSSTRVKRK
ncbi:MAG: hypothetical protein PVH84_11685 [Candidatus Aminicenantes bacterium]